MTTAPPTTIVETVVEPGVLRWTLTNEARRNAVDPQALRWIAARCEALASEVVLLDGAGETAFCAGFDLTALGEDARDGALPDAPLIAATGAMLSSDATFVAVVGGYAIGAGVELLCSCDLRLAADEGVYLSVPVGSIGVVYHARGLARMHAILGTALTQRLVLLGERVTAPEAMAAGAFVRLAPRAALDEASLAVARQLRSAAPLGVRAHRDLLRRLLVRPQLSREELTAYEDARERAYASEDHREGRDAIAARRPPKFRGR